MKRKIVSTLLIASMAATMLAGCGGDDAGSTGGNAAGGNSAGSTGGAAAGTEAAGVGGAGENTAGEVEPGGWDGETTHIVMTYLTLGNTPADVQKVQDAVNAITVPDIGVEVEFKPIAIFDTSSQYSLWISSGEQVDLMMVAFTNLATYADQGLIEPLDDYLTSAPYISSCVSDEGYPLFDGSYYEGEVYGITPVMYYYGTGGCLIIPDEYMEKAGIEYTEETLSLDDIGEIYGKLKEAYPDKYPCGLITKNMTATVYNQFGGVFDALGATPSSGVLIGTDSTTVENLYASEGYYDYLKHVKEWHDAGYVYPDAATTDSTANELTKSGVILTHSMTNQPVMLSDFTSATGFPAKQFMTSDSFYTAQSSSGGTFWTVPITSTDPEAALRFLDYTYSNHDLHNLILWGIEGEHFEIADADNMLIQFPEGVDGNTSSYYNTLGLYGDRRYEYVWDVSNDKATNEAYTKEAMANPTKAVGYAYNTINMATKIANVDAVLNQYLPTLESGSESDLDSMYEQFLADLENAGINDIIADNQAQFDEWLAQQ